MSFYRQRIDATTNAGTQITVQLLALQPGELVELYAVCLLNKSGESVIVQFGILEGGDFFSLSAKQTVANNDSACLLGKLFFYEGQALAARVTGVADSSTVTLWASGIHHSPDPDPPIAAVDVPQQKRPQSINY